MANKKRQKRKHGHYCWVCDCFRPNGKFSGRGRARHVCRQCAKLGGKELEYRSVARYLERCVSWAGTIPRKKRRSFEKFLSHKNPRVRARAEEIFEEDRFTRFLANEPADVDADEAEEVAVAFAFL